MFKKTLDKNLKSATLSAYSNRGWDMKITWNNTEWQMDVMHLTSNHAYLYTLAWIGNSRDYYRTKKVQISPKVSLRKQKVRIVEATPEERACYSDFLRGHRKRDAKVREWRRINEPRLEAEKRRKEEEDYWRFRASD